MANDIIRCVHLPLVIERSGHTFYFPFNFKITKIFSHSLPFSTEKRIFATKM